MRADAAEAHLLARFTAHPVLGGIAELSQEDFLDVLLQRRFLSLMFPAIYDIGIDALSDPTALRIVRQLIREEYPDASGDTPSHREDLVGDLLVLGATKAQILGCRPRPVTATVIRETFELMGDAAAACDDMALLTILRFWGEVLVSVEYGEFWRRMATPFQAAGVPSPFYHPHWFHDGREPLATALASSSTHSGQLGACLNRLLASPGAEERFCRDRTARPRPPPVLLRPVPRHRRAIAPSR